MVHSNVPLKGLFAIGVNAGLFTVQLKI